MRIACVAPDDLSTIIFCSTLARLVRRRGGQVVTISPVDLYARELAQLATSHVALDMARFVAPRADLKYVWALYRVLRRGRFDAMIAFTTKPNIYGAVAATLAGIGKIVIAVRGLGRAFAEPETWRDRWTQAIVSLLYRGACSLSTVVWFTNSSDRDSFVRKRMVDDRKVVITKNAVDASWFSAESVSREAVHTLRHELGLRDGERTVVMVARMNWLKGVREFVDAARLLRSRLPNVRFILVGPAEDGGAQAVPAGYLRDAEKEGNFLWTGFRKEVKELYALADIAVLPSYYKEGGYPRALLEPMALGKPVIAADTDDCRGPVENNKNGYLVPPRDAAALAGAVLRLITEPGVAAEFGNYSRRRIESEFDERTVVAKFLDELTRRGVLA